MDNAVNVQLTSIESELRTSSWGLVSWGLRVFSWPRVDGGVSRRPNWIKWARIQNHGNSTCGIARWDAFAISHSKWRLRDIRVRPEQHSCCRATGSSIGYARRAVRMRSLDRTKHFDAHRWRYSVFSTLSSPKEFWPLHWLSCEISDLQLFGTFFAKHKSFLDANSLVTIIEKQNKHTVSLAKELNIQIASESPFSRAVRSVSNRTMDNTPRPSNFSVPTAASTGPVAYATMHAE